MTSKMAIEDIYTLKKEGVDVTPEQIIKLNELGLRVERPDSWDGLGTLPRVAFVGEVVFNEPTVGAELWFQDMLRIYGEDDSAVILALRVVQCTTRWDLLPDPQQAESVKRFMEEARSRLEGATYRQVMAALDWCVLGGRETFDELKEEKSDEEKSEKEGKSLQLGLVHEGQALALGTMHDLKSMTTSALLATVDAALDVRLPTRAQVRKRSGEAFGNYMKYLDSIRKGANENGC